MEDFKFRLGQSKWNIETAVQLGGLIHLLESKGIITDEEFKKAKSDIRNLDELQVKIKKIEKAKEDYETLASDPLREFLEEVIG